MLIERNPAEVDRTPREEQVPVRCVGVVYADARRRPIRLGRSSFILFFTATGPVLHGTLTRSLPLTSVGVGFVSFKGCFRPPMVGG